MIYKLQYTVEMIKAADTLDEMKRFENARSKSTKD